MTAQQSQGETIALLEGTRSLKDLYPVLEASRYTAGWHKKRRSLWPQPDSAFTPRHWRYAEARLALDKAGDWISTELAERRNLLMFNPVDDNDYATVRTLVAAYQMVRPGEYARAHRHSPSALRMVLDAPGGLFTVVNGAQIPMISGDILLTPGTFWHSHFSEESKAGGRNSYWIDFLDVPLVQLLEPMFYEEFPGGIQPVTAAPDRSELWFPFEETKRAIAATAPDGNGVRRHVLASQSMMPSMELSYRHLPAGGSSGPLRTTESRILAVAEGEVTFRTPSLERRAVRGDIFAVPCWVPFEIAAGPEAYVFEVSDAPVQRMLGLYRTA